MKLILGFLASLSLFAETLVIVDSIGLQRAKAEIENSATVEIKLQKSEDVKLTSSTESLTSEISGDKNIFQSVTPGKWKIESKSKVLEVKILK